MKPKLKILGLLTLTLLFGCEKDDPVITQELKWSDSFPYKADEYSMLTFFASDVIHENGNPVDTDYETGESYSSHNDPNLRLAIESDLKNQVSPERITYYLSFLDSTNFQNATTPRTARKFLGGMCEGRYNADKGTWEDPDRLKEISQAFLDWLTNPNDTKKIAFQDEETYGYSIVSGTAMTSWINVLSGGGDLIIVRNSWFNDAAPLTFMASMADEYASSIQTNANSTIEQSMQGFSYVMLNLIYTSNYGLQPTNDGSVAGARATDYAIRSYLNGWKSTPEIESVLNGRLLNSINAKLSNIAPGVNTVEESIIATEEEPNNSPELSMTQKVQDFYSLLFGVSITSYNQENMDKMIEAGHHFFDDDKKRKIIEEELK